MGTHACEGEAAGQPMRRTHVKGPSCAPERNATHSKRKPHLTSKTRFSGAMMMLLWLHSGVLRYPQRASSLPLGKTLVLTTGTVDTCCASALCSFGEHGNILFSWRFHDSFSYPLVMASLLLPEFVTLALHRAIAPEASYYAPSASFRQQPSRRDPEPILSEPHRRTRYGQRPGGVCLDAEGVLFFFLEPVGVFVPGLTRG
jgi:hypothetical protein